ncbi:hypothetical protein COJ17_29300 [Bacillus thuringiensis]|uniref:hypothetical protein n=1 Tax=Bacillus thuringiensis TaxID=1428 RepID=UPI000BF94918|nr:hypothetical protein [Bacillus thuringiensis]PEW37399.1 hypothetical protein CN444_29470 [Bacillus thuringiensis]PFK07391.1 hypothetical protein COJ17_29300 [Bacillus thuringiensis]
MKKNSYLYEKLGFSPATNKQEYLSLLDKKPQNLITSKEEFDKYFQKSFNFLETESIEIEFDDQGFENFRYIDLADKLTFNQFSELLARLGMSLELFEGQKDHRCKRTHPTSPKECVYETGYTCPPRCGTTPG